MRLRNLGMAAKLRLIVGLTLAGMLAVALVALMSSRRDLMADRELKTRHLVETAVGLVEHYAAESRAGRLDEAQAKAAALAALGSLRYGGDEYFWVNDVAGVMVLHPNAKLVGTSVLDMPDTHGRTFFRDIIQLAGQRGEGFVTYTWPKPGRVEPVRKLSFVKAFAPWGWIIGTGIYLDDVDEAFNRRLLIFGGIILVLSGGVGLTGWRIALGVSRPLAMVTTVMHRLADGDTDFAIGDTGRGDEIGNIHRALAIFRRNALERENIGRQVEAEQQRKLQRQRRLEELTGDFETNVASLLASVTEAVHALNGAARSMSDEAQETSRRTDCVAAASGDASSNVQSLAGAADSLAAAVRGIGRKAAGSAEMAGTAVRQARDITERVVALNQAAGRIGEVVGFITEIASQTNLLALNATIEAARAGEAGKGFAVVANEVKSLANQTARATDEISGQIGAVQEQAQQSAAAIRVIAETIAGLDAIAASIARDVEEQDAATQQIARNVQQAALGTDQVSANIAGLSASTRQTGESSLTISRSAARLQVDADSLKGQIETFLRAIHAA